MSDYERGYKQGVEDAHRCEQRHAQIDQLEADVRALRDENARLRGLLAEIQFDCEHIGGIQHLDKAERRTWVSVANRIKAALQPERGTRQ